MTFYAAEIAKIKNNIYSNTSQLHTVIEMRNYLDANYNKIKQLSLLSKTLFVSSRHLLRLFKQYYGQTPNQYLISTRIERSKLLLKEGASITDTCYAIGFESLGSFSTLFRSKTGLSPMQFQKSHFSRNVSDLAC